MSRSALERLLLLLLGVGTLLVAVGSITQLADQGRLGPWPARAALLGLFVLLAATVVTARLDALRTVRPFPSGSAYERQRHWNRLKATSLLHTLLLILTALSLVVALLARIRLLQWTPGDAAGLRVLLMLQLAMVLSQAYTHYRSLRLPREDAKPPGLGPGTILGLLLAILLLAVAALLDVAPGLIVGRLGIHAGDEPGLGLATILILGLLLVRTRRLPSPASAMTDEKPFYKGLAQPTRFRSLLIPILIAFTLLFLVLAAVLVFGLGLEGISWPVILGILAFVLIVVFLNVGISYRFARRRATVALYRERRTREVAIHLSAVAASWVLLLVLAALAALAYFELHPLGIGSARAVDVAAFGVLGFAVPLGIYHYTRSRKLRRLEARFPDFLRDLAASHQGGLTLPSAVSLAARGDYDALTPEIGKMADQLSFNTPFPEVLELLAARVGTPLIQRAVTLINEAQRSGGNTTEVLLAASDDAREVKALENERRSNTSLYTFVMYLVFLVFLGFAFLLYTQFVPQIIKVSTLAAGDTGPLSRLLFEAPTLEEYRTFYFCGGLVQSVGNGAMVGVLTSGRVKDGLPHIAAMVAVTILLFLFL
jgi:flagellar protein FlaJ